MRHKQSTISPKRVGFPGGEVYTCIHMCVRSGLCLCVYVCMQGPDEHIGVLYHASLYTLRQTLSLSLELALLSFFQLGWQAVIHSNPPVSALAVLG